MTNGAPRIRVRYQPQEPKDSAVQVVGAVKAAAVLAVVAGEETQTHPQKRESARCLSEPE